MTCSTAYTKGDIRYNFHYLHNIQYHPCIQSQLYQIYSYSLTLVHHWSKNPETEVNTKYRFCIVTWKRSTIVSRNSWNNQVGINIMYGKKYRIYNIFNATTNILRLRLRSEFNWLWSRFTRNQYVQINWYYMKIGISTDVSASLCWTFFICYKNLHVLEEVQSNVDYLIRVILDNHINIISAYNSNKNCKHYKYPKFHP